MQEFYLFNSGVTTRIVHVQYDGFCSMTTSYIDLDSDESSILTALDDDYNEKYKIAARMFLSIRAIDPDRRQILGIEPAFNGGGRIRWQNGLQNTPYQESMKD